MANVWPATSLTLIPQLCASADRAGEPLDLQRRERAWRRFVELYGPVIHRLGRKRGLSREQAENATQNFFVKMVKGLPQFQYDPHRGRFRSWLCTVALHEIYKVMRESRGGSMGLEEIVEVPDSATEEWLRSKESMRMLQLAMEELRQSANPKDFEIFRLLAIEQRSGDEVAKQFEMTRSQTYSIKFRTLSRLRVIAQRMASELGEDLQDG